MAFPFAIVGFDLDGTLLDTSGDLTAAVNHALAEAGRPPLDEAAVQGMIGGGAKHMLAQALEASGGVDPQEGRRLYKLMLSYYADNVSRYTRAFPGALDALAALGERGVRLAVVTNKFESLARQVLADLHMLDRFELLLGGDTLGTANAKPSGVPIATMVERLGGGRAIFVGDSIYDIEAARNAGVPSIAVSFGFLHQPVETLRADAVIDHWDELIPTLEAFG